MILIDGKKIRDEILLKVKDEVKSLSFQPVFCDVLVGDDPVSKQYVDMKARNAVDVGISFHNASFPATITTKELAEEIEKLNKVPNMCGIIIQLPLPSSIDKRIVLDAIAANLDVDFLGSVASDLFYKGDTERGPARNATHNVAGGFPTALACMALLDSLNLDLKGKKIVVLGQGDLVGKPVSALLRFRNLDHIVITRKTPARNAYGIDVAGGENKEQILKEADIIISGIGKGKYITGGMIKTGAVLIDAGTSESDSGVIGDVDFFSVQDVAGFVSPVPGGVGPVTVAMLLENVLEVAKSLTRSHE